MTRRVMTVDDSVSIRQMIVETLEDVNFDVLEAEDGQDAMDLLEKESVDLVITDLNMPRMDGIELIKKIRNNPDHRFIPIIMLTTESAREKKEMGRNAGATGWIVKPFDAESLLRVVKKVIG